MVSVSLYTLGCKVNQLESEALADAFRRAGFTLLPWEPEADEEGGDLQAIPADPGAAPLLVVNTCTVTSKAEQKARRIIRRALRSHPWSALIVTGCYAQLNPQALEDLEEEPAALQGAFLPKRLFVVGGDRKSALLDLPGFLAQESKALLHETAATNPQALIPLLPVLLSQWVQAREGSPVPQEDRFRFNPGDFSFHSRASLKIQDGCDKRCSYCRVSLARGPSVSLEARKSLSGLRALEEKGYGEAVLTGVNIGQYREGPRDLADLLDYLLAGTGYIRLRLSSLGPDELSPRLMAVLGHPRIRPHFHLSVQSGSSLILEKMGRSYTPDAVVQGVTQLRSVKEDPFIACDIITGFPGETKEAFEATRRLCEGLDFAWIHPFPYSPRPGTKAYTFKEPVSEREARFRVERLLALAAEGRRGYIRRWIGKTVEGIAEAPGELSSPGAVVADNYLKLLLTIPEGAAPPQPGSALRCRICGVYSGESPFDAAATLVST